MQIHQDSGGRIAEYKKIDTTAPNLPQDGKEESRLHTPQKTSNARPAPLQGSGNAYLEEELAFLYILRDRIDRRSYQLKSFENKELYNTIENIKSLIYKRIQEKEMSLWNI
jgi:hypothetical protein